MPVPFADLQLQYQTIKSEIDGAIAAVIRDNAFIRGPYVDAFEREFAAAVDVKHCVSCANGTDALYLAMAALKVQAGRRGDHHGAFLDQHLGDDYACRRHRGVLRHRRRYVHDRSGGDRGRDHAAHRRHHSGASVRAAGRHGRDHGDRAASTSSG